MQLLEETIQVCSELDQTTMDDDYKEKYNSYKLMLDKLTSICKTNPLKYNKSMPHRLVYDLIANKCIDETHLRTAFGTLSSARRCMLAIKIPILKTYLTKTELRGFTVFTQCAICLEVRKTYTLRNCPHSFCKSCLKAIHHNTILVKCPLCRTISTNF